MNTTCTQTGVFTNCSTTGSATPNYSGFSALGAAIRANRERHRQQRAEEARDTMRRDVGARLANGDCPGAIQIALNGGDVELANQARQFCAAAPASPGVPAP